MSLSTAQIFARLAMNSVGSAVLGPISNWEASAEWGQNMAFLGCFKGLDLYFDKHHAQICIRWGDDESEYTGIDPAGPVWFAVTDRGNPRAMAMKEALRRAQLAGIVPAHLTF